MTIKLKRVYDEKEKDDGYRVLIDRLWPRGVKKTSINEWLKDIAPSSELRIWYGHNEKKWDSFKSKYKDELNSDKELVLYLLNLEKQHGTITLLYGSKSPFNNGVVLYAYLDKFRKHNKNLI
jgi:uncharacterized protein YeaO (DUF488 family)